MRLTHMSRIYFGLNDPEAGADLTEGDWLAFENEQLAAFFPDGYTVLKARGAWRDLETGELIQEPSFIVEVAHDGSEETMRAIRAVATTYKLLFHQQAVMVQTIKTDGGFI